MNWVIVYAIAELLLAIHISLSNFLVLFVYLRYRHVRTVTNSYIFSLALTDFLAGCIGIPVTVISVLTLSPRSYNACLSVHLLLCILCTISTFHMLAIGFDKYITICGKDQLFKKRARHMRAVVLIALCWTLGTIVAIMPLYNAFGFAETIEIFHRFNDECHFTTVVDYRYLVYVIFFATILVPTILIVFFYINIYRRIGTEEAQVKCLLGQSERERRMAGRRKLIRILVILVVSYGICWYPLYMINTIDYFWPEFSVSQLTLFTVVLSHMSCALNPLIYAYGMPGFKRAFRQFFRVDSSRFSCPAYSNAYKTSQRNLPVPRLLAATEWNSRKISMPMPPRSINRHSERRMTNHL